MGTNVAAVIFILIVFVVGFSMGWSINGEKTAERMHQQIARTCPEGTVYSRDLVACVTVLAPAPQQKEEGE